MSYAFTFPPGGFLADIRAVVHASVAGVDDISASADKTAVAQRAAEEGAAPPDPYAGDPKWPAWKVSLAVIFFCGAFWIGIGYLLTRIL
jgi:hypothetical protein